MKEARELFVNLNATKAEKCFSEMQQLQIATSQFVASGHRAS